MRRISRRRSLQAAGLLAGSTVLPGCSAKVSPSEPLRAPVPHQRGVVTPPLKFAVLAAFDVAGTELHAVIDHLASRAAAVHAGGSATVTVGVGAALVDDRFGLRAARPQFLTGMPDFPNDVLDTAQCGGDVLLQICAADTDETAAVLRDVAAEGSLRPRWRIDGFRAENRTTAAGLPTTRNPFGFREGAGNPDPADESLMEEHVWAGVTEPAWAVGGTYQVVRLIRLATQLWDRDPVTRQEAILGRRRTDGAPLTGGGEDRAPDYAGDPHGQYTPLDAHIRRADPRTPETRRNRILRRSYSYRRQDEDGLIFICFQRNPESGFASIQRRLSGEELDRYILPFGGGYMSAPMARAFTPGTPATS